ncbi:MAG: tryptophan--tRNA ligase [Proteobacteria bacterium]|jgi:tryptophanyl-tRNA synthetase|nr:tryptophan--tRNA ligase [Desulfocapsa sp.]MBU3945280.1 tryptophan--tRNA ligase [Pseudomonadota bacterium]MBU4028620.1 tryptophan--tRNA ligase [Pseudomonadota bacterium]MBU4044350.1 tryptophan--tRNA ligase [Pseudomonadota bacterium]MBU4083472.1 tryptophan--tRNA ligase [Pseudomonadota bacterium]
MKILSGIQPSGQLHIGNYFGMMKSMIAQMESSELYVFIVDLHAMTSVHDRDRLAAGTLEAAADFLALGLDPEKCIFWVQSDVPEVCELTWVLSTIAPMGLIERCHSYKDKVANGIEASHGLFSYPVLMAADILLYQADQVPVGQDQKQHLEVARDLAQKFNKTFGETFVVPEPAINKEMAIVPGLDGRKMSKSYGNTIPIFLEGKALKKRVMAIETDATPVEDPKDSDKCNLFAMLKLFATPERLQDIRDLYVDGGAAYGYIKLELLDLISDHFADARRKKAEYLADPAMLREILKKGADKARAKAIVTLDLVRDRVGLKY